MANLCCNKIALVGNPKNLHMLIDVINQVSKIQEYITPEKIQDMLGFPCDGWGRSYDDAMGIGTSKVDDEEIENGVLYLDCTTAWGSIDAYWEALAKWLDLKGFASFSEADGDIWTLNDPEGIFFPESYLYDDEGEESAIASYEYFNSKEDLVSYLNKASNDTKTFEEWEDLLEENSELGKIVTIEKYGDQLRWRESA